MFLTNFNPKSVSPKRSSAIILGNDKLMTHKFISVDSFPESNVSSTTKSYRNNLGNEVGVALVWAEDPTNTLSIPIKNLVAKMNITMELSNFHPFAVIIIFPLKNDFLKIRVLNYDLLYNSPHLKRKTFIQNLSKKYIADTSTPEYFSSLFNYI
ncbi:hypothetical protein MXB_1229 [Myxobolus squamalis]|nr:hypothetical protein MXB_1229 [Myxobolus squamalis]